MKHCQHCSYTFVAIREDGICPRCQQPIPRSPGRQRWTNVARVSNLAEVGYLADLLEGEGIATQILQDSDFCAVSGSWLTTYLLRVPGEKSGTAIQCLKDEVAPADDSPWSDEAYAQRHGAGKPLATWRSVVLVLMAGGIAYYAGRVSVERPHRPIPLRESLWQAISEDDQPLVSFPNAKPSRRLRFEPATRSIMLEDDADGDGQFRVRRFQQGQLVEESIQ